jgi:hypothetical protein
MPSTGIIREHEGFSKPDSGFYGLLFPDNNQWLDTTLMGGLYMLVRILLST